MDAPNDKSNPIRVDTSPTKVAVVDSLIRDATTIACLFDLLDNAVDAARHSIVAKGAAAQNDKLGLPTSYAGYKVALFASPTSVTVNDNCGGIDIKSFRKSVLRFGERSDDEYSIGVYGVGLNRALFKLGESSTVESDDGTTVGQVAIERDKYLRTRGWTLPAHWEKSSGKKTGTTITISKLTKETHNDLANPGFVHAVRSQISKRYTRFLSKGMRIEFNEESLDAWPIPWREDSPFEPIVDERVCSNGVHATIRAIQHREFFFAAELGLEGNKAKTPSWVIEECGWYAFCNDRGVVLADRSAKTGWNSVWHAEFNGFVGVVDFVSPNPAALPWDTTKSDLDTANIALAETLNNLTAASASWRKCARYAKKMRQTGKRLLPNAGIAIGEDGKTFVDDTQPTAMEGGKPKKPSKKTKEISTLLPPDIDETHCKDKLLALVHEAKSLSVVETPYAALLALRALTEISAWHFVVRHGLVDEVRHQCAERRTKPDVPAPIDRDDLRPGLDDLLQYFERNRHRLGPKHTLLKGLVAKVIKAKSHLNEVAHDPYVMIGKRRDAIDIRDKILPFVRHLIEY
ncbi:MAG: ATP-binding protein [Chromatiales bacterium]|nr:ATP-binding protein [Chromatiales bacterium]